MAAVALDAHISMGKALKGARDQCVKAHVMVMNRFTQSHPLCRAYEKPETMLNDLRRLLDDVLFNDKAIAADHEAVPDIGWIYFGGGVPYPLAEAPPHVNPNPARAPGRAKWSVVTSEWQSG